MDSVDILDVLLSHFNEMVVTRGFDIEKIGDNLNIYTRPCVGWILQISTYRMGDGEILVIQGPEEEGPPRQNKFKIGDPTFLDELVVMIKGRMVKFNTSG